MLSDLRQRIITKAGCFAGIIRRDDRGVAAVEFGLIVPIMFTLFIGSIEFSQAITVDRRVTQAASSTADLIARAPAEGMTTSEVDGQLKIIEELMRPYEVSRLSVTIFSVKAVMDGGTLKYKVDWSRDNTGAQPMARGTDYTGMPADLLAEGESVIVGHAKYNYAPLIFNHFIKSAFDLEEKFYLKPRNSSCVTLKPDNCVTS